MLNKNNILTFIKNHKAYVISVSALIVSALVFFCTSMIIAKTTQRPIAINTADDLDIIRNNLSGYYLIKKDIDFSSYSTNEEKDGWVPLGTKEQPFTGKIDFNYHTLSNLHFSDSYISNQFLDENVDEVLIGFLGYSSGTIIHANIYNPHIPELNDYKDNSKCVIFGTACAINDGYVTTISSVFLTGHNSFCGNNFIFGTLVGVNNKQILNVLSSNTISISPYGEGIVGGIAGKSTNGSTYSYIVRRGYITVNIDKEFNHDFYIGGITGVADNTSFTNVFHGPTNYNSIDNSITIKTSSTVPDIYAGGISGYISGSNSVLKNCYSCSAISINGDNFQNSGTVIGKAVAGVHLQSVVADNVLMINSGGIQRKRIPIGNVDGGVDVKNSIYIARNSSDIANNVEGFKEESFENVSLSKLGWPTDTTKGFWTKGSVIFYLTVL